MQFKSQLNRLMSLSHEVRPKEVRYWF